MGRGAVRAAGSGDLDRVAALWTALVRHHAELDPRWRLADGAEARFRELLRGWLGDPDVRLLVFEEDGALLGFSLAQRSARSPLLTGPGRVEITELLVRPAARRRGIGRELVSAMRAWAGARGAERIEVRVVAGNAEGQAFWRALGWEPFVDVLQQRL